MKLKSITPIEPKPARCIEVAAGDRLFAAGGGDGKSIVSHNSVIQRNLVFGCIMRPESWRFLGIDLKRVELSAYKAYSNVVLGIATTLEDALLVLRFGQETMMKRYAEMEQLGFNNFLDLPERGTALMIMVDEAGELLSDDGVKALSEHTPIPTTQGLVPLRDISPGDAVFDNHGDETTVVQKYEPAEQAAFEMSIRDESNNDTEKFISGSEHNWVAYFTDPDGTTTGPQVVDTTFLYEFKEAQKELPEDQQTRVRFRRG